MLLLGGGGGLQALTENHIDSSRKWLHLPKILSSPAIYYLQLRRILLKFCKYYANIASKSVELNANLP